MECNSSTTYGRASASVGAPVCRVGPFGSKDTSTTAAMAGDVVKDRGRLRRFLGMTVLPDDHPVARIGKRIIRAQAALSMVRGVLFLAILGWVALHDALTASILGVTAVVIVALYLTGTRRPRPG